MTGKRGGPGARRSAGLVARAFLATLAAVALLQLATPTAALPPRPRVTSLSPASGPTAGHTVVTITGTSLTGATRVVFGATAGTGLSVVSATKLKVTAPAHAAGVVDVKVTTAGGTSTVVAGDKYTYALAPKVTSLSPTSGSAAGHTVVTITGTNLTAATKVVFGTTAGTGLTVLSATKLRATAPVHATGVVDVRVTTPGGTSAVAAGDKYTYVVATTGLAVSGRLLYRDGTVYTPRGFNMVGVLSPSWCPDPIGTAARAHLGQDEMIAAAAWHATVLRFQVSQRGLADPAIAAADRAAYLQQVEAGVSLARANGFDVIVSMQDQSIGCGPAHPFPTRMTQDAWTVLAPAYAGDPYVMFELFNEPNENNTTTGWNQWRNGGTTPNTNLGDTAVGMQTLLDSIRGLGLTNVAIADGLNLAERLAGYTTLSDATGNLMYGVHPYFYTGGQPWWDSQYGTPGASIPVIASEWDYVAVNCGSSYQTLGPMLLQYLHDKHIGVLGHAFDVPGTIITGAWDWTPTDCATSSGGSGQDLLTYLTGMNSGDTTAPGAPTGVSATAVEGSRVDLTWAAATDDVGVATYRVIRDGYFIALATGTGYSDTSMSSGHTHAYTIYAVDAAYNVSPASSTAVVAVPAMPAR